MKRKPSYLLSLFVGVGALAAAGATSTLDNAISLLNDGKPQQARELINTISQNDPKYAAARCYDLLCLHELKDYAAFLDNVDSAPVEQALISPAVREQLNYKHIDALFQCRRFEELQPKIQAFLTENPASSRLAALAEYRMVGLFERGMKKTQEACLTKEQAAFEKRWAEGKVNLEQFLSLSVTFPRTNYNTLRKHDLKKDVWVARLTLGDEKAVLDEIPTQDSATREKASLLRVQLYQKLQPENTTRNLQMLEEFLKVFPESQQRKRVEVDMAGLNFHRGKELCAEADAAEKAGDNKGAAEKRTTARGYFDTQRRLESGVTVDKSVGIEASDIIDLREDLLYSHLLEKDYATLKSLTSSLIAQSPAGDVNWIMARLYDGIALLEQTPPQAGEATVIFDEVLALGFKNKPDHDRMVAVAARWRVNIALNAGDNKKAREVVQLVQGGDCSKDIKSRFLKDHASLVSPQTIISK